MIFCFKLSLIVQFSSIDSPLLFHLINPPVAIVCEHLPDPINGDISFYTDTTAPFEFGANATYKCDSGFGLSGDSTIRTCVGDGSSPNGEWSENAPTCECKWIKLP